MATKGEVTRDMILRKTAPLFNERGFAGASLSDVMKATGLQKGGLYNHFDSKEDLALEAFDYASRMVLEWFEERLASKNTAMSRLHALLESFVVYADHPPVAGGCPLMNTAVENDDSNPRLRERAKHAMNTSLAGIRAIFKFGVKQGELRADTNVDEAALVVLSAFEGALMISRLHRDSSYMRRTVAYLQTYVDSLAAR